MKLNWTDEGYTLLEDVFIFSERYGKWLVGYEGDYFDGATGAIDLCPEAFIPHDIICEYGVWTSDPDTQVTNWQASHVYDDQLNKYGFPVRGKVRFVATFLFGGKDLKKF